MIEALSRKVTIVNELGLHARSAAKIAEIAKKANSNVWIIKDDERADATGILEILMLECTKGSDITVEIDQPIDMDILNSIVALIQSGFGE
jgi:phosphocarrier protein